MPGTYQLDQNASAVLDHTGAATVRLSPATTRQVWNVTNIAVSGSSVTNIPVAIAALGSTQLGGTYSGNSDSDAVSVMVWPGQNITVSWTGGDAGANVTAYVYGTYTTTGSS